MADEKDQPFAEEIIPSDDGLLIQRLVPVERGPMHNYTLYTTDGEIVEERHSPVRLTPGEYLATDDGRRFHLLEAAPEHFDDSRFDGYALRTA